MVKFEPQFQIKCIGRGEEDARFTLEVIDMYWDSKGAFKLSLVSSGIQIQIELHNMGGEQAGDCFGKKEEVIEGLSNMCTVVGDIMSSVAWVAGYGGARCCGKIQSGSW